MIKSVLITGATGTVGKEVLDQLLEKGNKDITLFCPKSRKNRRMLRRYIDDVEVVYGDLSNANEVQQLSGRYDAVIHLAAVIPPLADEQPTLASIVNVEGTKNLISVLEGTSPETFFMYSSSIAVYGDRLVNPEIRVGDELKAMEDEPYASSKLQAEAIVQASPLDWTIFRLTAIMGAGNHKMTGLMFHMPLETRMEIATPADTARAFVNGLEERTKLSRQIFNLGGGVSCRTTYRELLTRSFELYGLGGLNFPEKTFAEKNFHCGDFADGDKLEAIVKFRKDTLQDYYGMAKRSIHPVRKLITFFLRAPIKYWMVKKSEPLQAYIAKDKKEMDRFF